MERKGQGAIEYLLIIGAAILVVAIVIVAITSVTSANSKVSTSDQNNASAILKCQVDCNNMGSCGTIAAPTGCALNAPSSCVISGATTSCKKA
ncbi:Class III signal peptide [uncultured archaeon]|nr:Class III signal peptide [uncultured archaeon]